MAESLNQKVKKVLRDKKNYKRYVAVLLVLSLIVGFGTVTVLHKEGEALTHQKKVLECSYVAPTGDGYAGYCAHVHNDDCYDKNGQLVCQLPVIEAHYHTDACWGTEKELACGLEENAGHVHTDACYARGEDLICGLEETEGHTHGHDCYLWYTGLTCGQDAYPAHTHDDNCYSWSSELSCGQNEYAAHEHDDNCYYWYTDLVCGMEQGEDHTHDESCYGSVRGDLICGMTEGPGHTHDASCWTSVKGDLICGMTEGPGHTHDDSCYGEVQGELICQIPECEPHTHTEACHPLTEELICGKEEGEGAHTHDESCYHEVKKCICGMEGIHIHTADCYDAAGNLACGQKQLEMHVHNENCFKMVDMTPEEIAALGLEEHYDVTDEAYTWVSAGDPDADVENWNDWNLMFQDLELSGNWSEDLLTVARTQFGYSESTANFAVSSTEARKGYTRYGAWYGIPYGDWCAMFASFCIRWAGISEEAMPVDCNCQNWIKQLSEKDMYGSAKVYLPKAGDLVFYDFNEDGVADHVGIVVSIDPENDILVSIEGNRTDTVESFTLRLSEACVMGYGLLPVNPDPGVSAVSLMPAQVFDGTVGDVTVTVYAPEGAFPANTRMELALVEDEEILSAAAAAVDEEEIETDESTNRTTTYKKDVKQVRAVDITFYDVNNNEIQPLIPISVNMTGDFLEEVENAEIVHMENNSAQPVENAEKEENDVSFAADSFSTYVVVGSDKIATEYTLRTNNREDVTFVVSATFGPEAKIPDGAWISITEYKEDSYQFSQAKETVINAKKAENEAFDENGLGLVALDISLLDEFAFPIEPAPGAEIKISLEMKKLPETTTQDVLSQTLEIQHLDTSAGYTQVKTVAGKDNIAFADGGVKAAFTVESFSTFTLTWGAQSATIHFGTLNTDTNEFVELSDEHVALLDTSAGSVSLKNNFERYRYRSSTYKASASADTVDIIGDVLTRTENGWTIDVRYYDENDQPITETVTIANGSDIYAYYAIPSEPHGSTPEGDIPKPKTDKNVSTSNGVATVTLDITGNSVQETQTVGANVIVVLDRTYSMAGRDVEGTTKERWEVAQEAVGVLVDALDCERNTINLALVPFDREAWIQQWEGESWTDDGDAFADYVMNTLTRKGVSNVYGTNWEAGLYQARQALASRDTNNDTYVIFLTDGEPNRRGTGSTIYNVDEAVAAEYALTQAKEITKVASLYGVFCGASSGYNRLNDMIVDAGGIQTINGTSEQGIHDAFANIASTIINNLGASNVNVDDGVTQLSSVSAQISGTAGPYQYYRSYKITPNADGSTGTYKIGEQSYTVNLNDANVWQRNEGTTEAPSMVYYYRTTWSGAPGASFSDDNGVTWDLGAAGVLEKDVVYTLQFQVWPSQEAYDLLADFRNNAKKITAQSADVKTQFEVTIGGATYSYDKTAGTWTNGITDTQLQALIDAPNANVHYELKTNTHLNTTYSFQGQTYTDSYSAGTGSVEVESSQMTVQKLFAHSINSVSPYTSLTFYLKRDGMFYMKDGTLSNVDPSTVSDTSAYYSIVLPNNVDPQNPLAPENWTGSVYIAPGVMTADGLVMEQGHKYSLSEVITSGDVYEYEFKPQTVRPMEINGQLTFLVLEDDYYKAPQGATIYNIPTGTGTTEKYFVSSNNEKLVGTNAKTAELDITKVVVDQTGKLTTEQLNSETFTYRVTLTAPLDADVSGIIAYEYVPRYDDAPASNRYTIFGYQSSESDSVKALSSDVTRFSGKIYGGYTVLPTTQTYAPGERPTLGEFFTADPGGETKSVTLDITLKQLEILRFTNLPSELSYTITEMYANLKQADPCSDSQARPTGPESNLEAQGYSTSLMYCTYKKGESTGSVAGNTISGTITNLDTRYYNQFTNIIPREVVDIDFAVTKHLLGYDWDNERYYFILEAGTCTYADETTGTSPMPPNSTRYLTNESGSEDVTYNFGKVRYLEEGVYTYTLKERDDQPATKREGVHGYGTTATITVTVGQKNGTLAITNVKVEKPSENNGEALVSFQYEDGILNTTFSNFKVTDVKLLKIGGDDMDTRLSNAQFELYSETGEKMTVDALGNAIGVNGLITTAEDDEDTSELNEKGTASLGSLIPGTYTLKEVKPPAGYHQMAGDCTITVYDDGTVKIIQPDYNGGNAMLPINGYLVVNNTNGTELPHTGGIGTMPYTLGGLALALGALALLLETRRRQRRRRDAA